MRAKRSSKISGAENGPGMRGLVDTQGLADARAWGGGKGPGRIPQMRTAWSDTRGLGRNAGPGLIRTARHAGPGLIRAAWAVQGAWADAQGLGRCAGPGRSKRPVRYGRSKRPGRCARPGRGNVQEALPVRTALAGQGACRIRPIQEARAGTAARPWWLVPEHADHSSAPFSEAKKQRAWDVLFLGAQQ